MSGAALDSMLSQYCISEGWVGDLANGVLKLGNQAVAFHGLSASDCGLLTLIRCYEPQDSNRILELFEEAATIPSSFCFSTTIVVGEGMRQPVFCVGESTGLEQKYSGTMLGVFMFPRFRIEQPTLLS